MYTWRLVTFLNLVIAYVAISTKQQYFKAKKYHETIFSSHVGLIQTTSYTRSKLQCLNTCAKQSFCKHAHVRDNQCILLEYRGSSGQETNFVLPQMDIIYTKLNQDAASCADLFNQGYKTDGIYPIDPDGQGAFGVYCELSPTATDGSLGGGWTVFQRRVDDSVDFYRYWADYEEGFGDIQGNYWMGLNKLSRITATAAVELHIYLEAFDGGWAYAHYNSFRIGDNTNNYRCFVSEYSGTAGDALYAYGKPAHNMQFTTRDRDNDIYRTQNCVILYKGAWWYSDCHGANLNGQYLGGYHSADAEGINWGLFRGMHYSLKTTVMKIRPK